ncbi:MAG: M48 family metallopeptidase [Methylococcales bacterium]|nr:M48 family metallopeptidase [Methylococcales bacterium]
MTSVPTYKGLFYADHEKSSINFSISTHGVIKFDDSCKTIEDISLQKTTLDLIGDPETTLQISWNNADIKYSLLCHDPALFDSLLDSNLMPDIQTQLQSLQKKQLQQTKSEKYRVPLYMGYIMTFFFSTYFMYSYSVPMVTKLIPYEWEKKIGSFAFENYQTGKSVVDHSLVNSAMDSIVKRIDEFDSSDIDYEVIVIEAEMVNAFAFPGGYIVVTTGLINNSDKPEEVAAVLSHELTHVLERHGMRKLVRQAGLGILIGIVFGDVSALSQLMELSSQLDSLSFDRSQEQHADDGGIKIMQAAGISPQHLVTFFKKIKELDSATGDIPEIFRTHPLTDDRIKRVAAAADPEQIFKFNIDWNKVKKGVE